MSSAANIPALSSLGSPAREFALWAPAYDDGLNPMLSLEHRFLSLLLPEFRNLDIFDVGCGTGRWLARMASHSPHHLCGIDSCPEMLERAREKLGQQATLLLGDATGLPISSAVSDLTIASFLASYVDDLRSFTAELRRIARAGSHLFLSDLHPDTVVTCNWNRAFRAHGDRVRLTTYSHSLPQIVSSFEAAGFEVEGLLEPPFGLPELDIFRNAGKPDAFYAADGLPAIYILHLRVARNPHSSITVSQEGVGNLRLTGARVVLDAAESVHAEITSVDGHVANISTSPLRRSDNGDSQCITLNLDGYLLLPGLINSHDHLEFGLYPNLGHGPYASCEEWASDIQKNEASLIAIHRRVPKDVRLWWGAIRNLLCGVTTVCHHNPLQPELLGNDFPVRVVREFGWAHSMAMDKQVVAKFKGTPKDWPFILHAAEGLGEVDAQEVFELDRQGTLDDRTVLVHGLALDSAGISLLNRRGAALAWCPTSNQFLFGKTHDRQALSSVNKLVLGSDSPLTAAGDLLDEVRAAHEDGGIAATEIYRMLFDRPPSVFRLNEGEGAIRPSGVSDLIAVRDTGQKPAETLAGLVRDDVELVIVCGRVQLASEAIARRLPPEVVKQLQPLEIEGILRWIRAPLTRLFKEAERFLGCEITLGNKRVRHVCSAWL
jgi:ubiquinone/menaquinone biosynthesis C-methylase UbiE/cytosine/adenosine deaminase-related metal-dependent hydrolase